jgi:hypothetical protein
MNVKILILVVVVIVVVGVSVFALQDYFAPKPAGQDWRTGAGTARQPPSGLSKNQTVFDQYFSNMVLVTDGWSGVEDATESFSSSDNVVVLADAKSTVTLLVYVDDAGNRGLFTGVEKEQNTAVGLSAINMGKFQPSSYIVRVLVNDVCIDNLVFEVT